jgi:RNA polymerase sigma-70 factor (ECF subfamily)
MSTAAVNSGLRRARAALAAALPAEEALAEPAEPERRAMLERFAAAFENADVSGLAELLREDIVLEMPPVLTWFVGRQAVTRFYALRALDVPGRFRLFPVMANGQPALAVYQREGDGAHHADAITVPTLTTQGIARIVTFRDPGLFRLFGLPPVLGADAARAAPAQDPAGTRWPG